MSVRAGFITLIELLWIKLKYHGAYIYYLIEGKMAGQLIREFCGAAVGELEK